jgi:quercetin dioxygenase-like cupin family protein
MKKIALAAALTAMSSPAAAEGIQISEASSRKSVLASTDQFTGTVIVESMFPANEQNGHNTGHVTFTPGARTAWHSHPRGQLLVITDGLGWVQEDGGEKRTVKAGDVVWFAPGVRHWHGATDNTMMRHIALSYMENGNNVAWSDQVTDQQFKD